MLTILMDLLFLCSLVIGAACFIALVVMVCMAGVSLGGTLLRSLESMRVFHRRLNR
jgi:hypothetical protein